MDSTATTSARRDLVRLIRLLPEVSRLHTAVSAVRVVIGAGMAVVFMVLSGRAVGDLVALAEGGDAARDAFTRSVVLVAIVYLLQQVQVQVSTVHATVLGRRVNGHLRERAMAALLRARTVDDLHRADLRSGVDRARELAPAGFTPGQAAMALVAQGRQHLDGLVAAIALSLLGFAPLAVVLLVLRGVGFWAGIHLMWQNSAVVAGGGSDQRRSAYFRDLALRPAAAKEVRIFGLTSWIAGENRAASMRVLEKAWRERGNVRTTSTMAAMSVLSTAVPAVWLGLATIRGDLDAGGLATTLLFANAVGNFSIDDSVLYLTYGAAAVPAILDLDEAVSEPPATRPNVEVPAVWPAREIRVEGLSYTYPGSDEPVFEDFDLSIAAGERLAVVGLNGAGKTTLVKLLCGLLRPGDGRILIDGIDIAEVATPVWRARVAALFQDFVHYDLSARDNVAFGDPRHPPGDEALARLADDVGITDLIERLPDGWDTVLTPEFTGGTDLSGGQWQRLALARALHAVDGGARLLFLDEPTANLDVRAEAQLYDRFLDLTSSRSEDPLTTVLISHRFSTVRRADRIVVIEDGRVVEDGDHGSLLADGGRYARLFSLQAERFHDA